MKKPLDIEYIKKYFVDFYTNIVEKNFLKKDDKSIHIHNNKYTLDKLGESDSGRLLFDGKEIVETDVMNSEISMHNISTASHADLRDLIKNMSTKLNTLADSDDETLDQLSEIVSYIKNNKDLIDSITTSKINITDIINSIDTLKQNTISGKVVDALVIKNMFNSIGNGESAYQIAVKNGFVGTEQEWLESLKGAQGESGNIDDITPASIGAATKDHTHGYMKTITLSTSEPTSVAEGEIVMVYEDSSTPPPITQTKTLTGITVTSPTKTEYTVGETLDLTGANVTAHFSDNSTQDITQISTFSPANGSVLDIEGNVTITVSYMYDGVEKDTTITISVSAVNTVEIVTWADGTDEQIAAMLDAHYNGDIDIHDYWHVGDERVVHLSAMDAGAVGETQVEQDVTMVLMNEGGKTLAEPINGINECAFIVGQKNCLLNTGYMNSQYSDNVYWDLCDRRKWCNNTYKNAFPITFLTLFKPHNNITAIDNSSSKISVDYFALPSEKEVFGSTTYANSESEVDNNQFTYYVTPANLVKKLGDDGSTKSWFTRSAKNNAKGYFCIVGTTYVKDAPGSSRADYNAIGISPYGCI